MPEYLLLVGASNKKRSDLQTGPVLQLVSESNPYNWAIAPGDEKAFTTYVRFDDLQSAINYGKNLIRCGWATEFDARAAKRFELGGYELKIRGLSQASLQQLVNELEARDWLNSGFFNAPQLEAQYQLHCDRDRQINIKIIDRQTVDGVYVVTVQGRTQDGRTDEATGAVPIQGLDPKSKANAMMKAETKAKRRVTLSICGLGWMGDEDSGTPVKAEVYDPPLDVVALEPTPALPPSEHPLEIWRTWKSEADATAWAKSQLPDLDEQTLKTMLDETQPDQTGKKAIAWINRITEATKF